MSSVEEKIKVLLITGRGRSGSTIIDNILGQIDGFFSTGELRFIHLMALARKRLCGCGVPIIDCEIWSRVFNNAFTHNRHADISEIARLLKNYPHKLHIPFFLLPGKDIWVKSIFKSYMRRCENLYRAIRDTVGCRVVVDSSKFPPYGYMLDLLPSIQLYVLHLVRDSRPVVASWLRKQPRSDAPSDIVEYLPRESVIYSSLLWNLWNIMAEYFWSRSRGRYMFLRYEDFVADPKQSIREILQFLNEDRTDLPFLDDRNVELKTNHTVSGNPVRMKYGKVKIQQNQSWEENMRRSHIRLVTTLTRPLLRKYGYIV